MLCNVILEFDSASVIVQLQWVMHLVTNSSEPAISSATDFENMQCELWVHIPGIDFFQDFGISNVIEITTNFHWNEHC